MEIQSDVSLSANPVEEVKVGYEILKSLNLRHRGESILFLVPSCARQAFPVIDTVNILEKRLSHIKEFNHLINNRMCC